MGSPRVELPPGSAGGPASVPRLRARSGTAPGSSRLQPRSKPADEVPSALEPAAAAAVAAGAAAEEQEEGRVALPFGVPPGQGTAAGRQWQVSPVVAAKADSAEMGDEGGEAEEQEEGAAAAAAAAEPRRSGRAKRKA